MILIGQTLLANEPLGSKERLLDPDFPVGVSIVFGADDWVRKNKLDDNAPDLIVNNNKDKSSKLYILPESGHMLYFDNPMALANIIINDIKGTNLPVGKDVTREYKKI